MPQDAPNGNETPTPDHIEGLTRRNALAGGAAAAVLTSSSGEAGAAVQRDSTASETATVSFEPYTGPAGGWGSARSLADILWREGVAPIEGGHALWVQNKPKGFACVSCAWAKPADHHPFEFCENGAKATAWEIGSARCTPEFFGAHTVTALERFTDHDLEAQGRLTHPMRWDKATDKYVPVRWDDAFAEIGRELKAMDPKSTVFYTSGRASLETSYMFQLFARMYGHQNLPDSSNMCHESTSVGLPESIGSPVGTVTLYDLDHTDCIFYIGHNVGTAAPRLLHKLQEARKRGVPIVTLDPMRARGLERFTNPQSVSQMLTGSETEITTQYLMVRGGGDIAGLTGICKALFALDDEAKGSGKPRVLDTAFIAEHTTGFETFEKFVRDQNWAELEAKSGLPRTEMEKAAATYANAKAVCLMYGMGVTQHNLGVQNVHMMANLLLLRGNIGKVGAGICPVRGHSNVQGQRTVGITEKPELVPVGKLEQQYGFTAPREKGLNMVEACEGIINGTVKGYIGLGGNVIRAVPETEAMERAWRNLRLTVQISTKLNRNHVIHGEVAYILPCLGRLEIDNQASGPQVVSVEDSTAHFHGSKGVATPASPHLLSEPAIVAGIAKATLAENPKVPWDAWVGDYGKVRDAMETTWPDMFRDYNKRLFTPGGFERPLGARTRKWDTKSGKANFILPDALVADRLSEQRMQPQLLRLITMRSNDQFNTTIYGYHDRFRGVKGTRMVVFMNSRDIARLGLKEGDTVDLYADCGDAVKREVKGFRVTPFAIAEGCCAAYFPEANPLIPMWHHDDKSFTPAYKSIPVGFRKSAAAKVAAA
jgi:molybdopterin-dependent oxidoreductase alpha subunit